MLEENRKFAENKKKNGELSGVNIWICVLDYLRFYPSECNKCEGGYWLGTVLQHGSSYLGDCSGGPHFSCYNLISMSTKKGQKK